MRVVPRLRSLARVRAKTMGMYVPKSPIAPFTSDHFDRNARFFLTFWIVAAAKPEACSEFSMVGWGGTPWKEWAKKKEDQNDYLPCFTRYIR